MSKINRKLSEKLFTLPIDDQYEKNINESLQHDSAYHFEGFLDGLSKMIGDTEPKPRRQIINQIDVISTKSNSPFYLDMVSANLKNKLIYSQDLSFSNKSSIIKKKRIKVSKCLKKTWKSKLNNLRDLLAKKLLEKVNYMRVEGVNYPSLNSLYKGN